MSENESTRLDPSMTLRQFHDALEDDNAHSLNAVFVAIVAEDLQAVIRLAQILAEHERTGLTEEMEKERYRLTKPLYAELCKKGLL